MSISFHNNDLLSGYDLNININDSKTPPTETKKTHQDAKGRIGTSENKEEDCKSEGCKDSSEKANALVPKRYLSQLSDFSLSAGHIEEISAVSTKLKQQLKLQSNEEATSIGIHIFLNFDRDSGRLHKKGSGIASGLTFLKEYIFIREKKFISRGGFKLTFKASILSKKTGKLKDAAHQKVVLPEHTSLTVREASLQQSFDHPNIVKIYAYVEYTSKKNVQLVEIFAELCNKTLHQEILEGEDFGFMDKVAIAKDIAGALAYLHKNGFSHNDIKPDNILIKYKKEGRSVGKLADFGMTRSINSAGAGFTKIYAPEQRDQKEKDKIYNDKTDVYQFGLLLWHMFHPNPPDHHLDIGFVYPHSEDLFLDWDCDSTDEITMMGFIGRCLEENPAKRPSMKEIEEFLSRF